MEENGKELMPEGLLQAIPYLEDLEGLPLESLTAVVRYRASDNRSWTVVARRRDTDPVLYGWIGGEDARFGSFSLEELEREGATRDALFVPQPLADVFFWERGGAQ